MWSFCPDFFGKLHFVNNCVSSSTKPKWMAIQLSLIDSKKKKRLQNDSNKSFKYHDIWWLVQFGRI
jgi:hypothetical protein